MQSAIEYAAIPTINLTPLFLVTNPLINTSQSDTLQVQPLILYIIFDYIYIKSLLYKLIRIRVN